MRAIRLDAWALAVDERQFNMEMQNSSNSDYIPKRSRFYQGLMDSPFLKSGKSTKYKELPSTVIIFITQDDIFKRDRVKYTFREKCEEIDDLWLEDGTTKIFLNMASKNGSKELVSLLQYMKNTDIDNPEILVKDERIVELDSIVTEVKSSEEWEDVSMNIYERGIERGIEQGIEQGIRLLVVDYIEENFPKEKILEKLQKGFSLDEKKALEMYEKYAKEAVISQ